MMETVRSLIDSMLDVLHERLLEGVKNLNSLGEEEKKEFLGFLKEIGLLEEVEQGTATEEAAAGQKT